MGDQRSHRPRFGRRHTSAPRRLLITGTPGAGKRPLGNYLAERHGFAHLDFENGATRDRVLGSCDAELRAAVTKLTREHRDVVVTWSVRSEAQLASIEELESLGFTWIWCDSDKGAACHALLANTARHAMPYQLELFDPDGRFRTLEAVTADALGSLPALPHRPPAPRKRPVARLRVAAGVAMAATAVALAGVLTGGALLRDLGNAGQSEARAAALPTAGVLVTGVSLGGLQLGDSTEDVRAHWGTNYELCQQCTATTWLYLWSNGSGAAVRFRDGKVTAVQTLGMPKGWHTKNGLRVGDLFESNDPASTLETSACTGYGAFSIHKDDTVTSILTLGVAVTGFALTSPSEPVCLTF